MGSLRKNDDMDVKSIGGSNFKFSAKKIEDLGASEYTLVVVAVDTSGSLHGYQDDLELMLGNIVSACRNPSNPRCDNMMLRVVLFNSSVDEFHGFRPVMDLNPDDYKGACKISGMTANIDAAYNAAMSCNQYAEDLVDEQFTVNSAIFIVTDGGDNMSKSTYKMVKNAFEEGVRKEFLESNLPVLIGIGCGAEADLANSNPDLQDFYNESGFVQYVDAGNASPETLAKIGEFVSQSASSQSKCLGSGGPSVPLTY